MSEVSDKVKLTVEFDNINYADAVALQQMFERYQRCGNMGHSEWIGYFADGDGAFRPKIKCVTSPETPEIQKQA